MLGVGRRDAGCALARRPLEKKEVQEWSPEGTRVPWGHAELGSHEEERNDIPGSLPPLRRVVAGWPGGNIRNHISPRLQRESTLPYFHKEDCKLPPNLPICSSLHGRWLWLQPPLALEQVSPGGCRPSTVTDLHNHPWVAIN